MPSGAKKRKAARKKKEKENNNINPSSTNNPPHGNNELKSIDEKGSDGVEGNSPSYDEHGDQHDPFNDGSEEVEVEVEDRDPSAARGFASDVKSAEEVSGDVKIDHVLGGKADNDVMIERGLESEESREKKDESFEHVETSQESCYESGNGGGGASNGESLARKNSKDENYDSLGEEIGFHELVKPVDSSPPEITLMTKNELVDPEEIGGNLAAEYSINSVKAVASVSEGENIDTGTVLLEKSVVPPLEAANLTVKTTEDTVYPLADPNATTSTLEKPKPKECDSEVLTSSAVASVSERENIDAGTVLLEKSVVPPLEVANPTVKTTKDTVYPLADENATTSTLEEPKPKDSIVLTSSAVSTKFTNGAEHAKNSETPELSENQPRVTSTPNLVQKTSWWSCCGLFEVVSGSDR